jgi:hypothetical protein
VVHDIIYAMNNMRGGHGAELEAEKLRLELRLQMLEAQDKARTHFIDFVKYVWPAAILGEHHRIMADAFDRIANGTLKRLIVNMPPRHKIRVCVLSFACLFDGP